MPRYAPDTMEHIHKSDLVQLSRDLLESVVNSTKMTTLEEMTPVKLAEAKVVLSYLNAANNTMKTKMQYFKMVGVEEKARAILEHKKLREDAHR